MFGDNGRMRQSLVVKFILCLIVPAYHTIQAELGETQENISRISKIFQL